MSSERLQKIIAAAGLASRRKAEELITAGRVTVNGEVKNELGSKADPETDDIRVDGKPLQAEQHVYVLLHKPKGYVTTVTDPEGRPTVMDLVKGVPARLYPVGRLDYLSEGLLLLTNDGEMAAKLTHASTHVPKKYLVKVSGEPTDEQIQQLRQGVQLPAEQGNIHAAPGEGGRFGGEKRRSTSVKTAPAKIELSREGDNPWYEVTLNEGRNRQIRRMFDFIGHHVEKIKRVEYGPLKLDVENGEFRMLKPAEVTRLQQAAEGRHDAPRARDERPRFSKPKRGAERPAFQKGSYRDRSKFESPRDERTRTARFDAEGKREAEPIRERFERPKFEKRDRGDRPAFRPKRDASSGFDKPRRTTGRKEFGGPPRGERPFRGKPSGDRSPRPSFDRPAARKGGFSRDRSERPGAGARGERPFRGKPSGDRGPRPSFDRSAARKGGFSRDRSERPRSGPGGERPFRGKPSGDRPLRPSFDRPASRKGGFSRDRSERPGNRFGPKPSFRKDARPRSDRPIPEREEPQSQEFVDKTAKRFAGKLESEGRGPRRSSPKKGFRGSPKGPRSGSKERGSKGSFRKPKDRR